MYFLLVSTIIVLPLIFSSNTVDPVLTPRLLFLGITMLVLTIIFIRKRTKGKSLFDFLKLIVFPVFFLFFLLSVFSLTQAVNPAEGLFDIVKTLLSFGLLIFASRIFIQNQNFISLLVKSVLISSLIATSIGLFQYFDNIPGNSKEELLDALYSINGLMAHKNQFAISLLLMLPFALFGVFSFKKWWRGISIYSIFMLLVNIAILQTRSVWLSTMVFFVGFSVLWAIISIKKKINNNSDLLKKGLVISAIVIVVLSGSFLIIQKSGTLILLKYQISTMFDFKSDNNQGRLKMWESTMQLSKDNPIFGVGAGNWKISVLPYYNINHGAKYQNWRRPHNDFLWILSEKGIFALFFYLLVFLIIAIYYFKILFTEIDKEKLLFATLMISGIGSYLIIAFFTFPLERINQQIYITLMMAGIIGIYYEIPAKKSLKKDKYLFSYYALAIIVFAISIYFAGIMVRSEVFVKKAYEAKEVNDWKKAIEYADEAITPFTTVDAFSIPIHLFKGMANVQLKNNNQAYKDLQTALGYFPTQVFILNNLASMSAMMGDNEKAISYIKQSLSIYPYYETGLFNLSKAYFKNKEFTKAYIALLSCNQDSRNKRYDDYLIKITKIIDEPTDLSKP